MKQKTILTVALGTVIALPSSPSSIKQPDAVEQLSMGNPITSTVQSTQKDAMNSIFPPTDPLLDFSNSTNTTTHPDVTQQLPTQFP